MTGALRGILLAIAFATTVRAQVFWGSDNARRIQGKPVAATAPADGQTWVFDGATGTWRPQAPPSGSGTVNSGTAGRVAYYGSSGTAVSGTSNLFVDPVTGVVTINNLLLQDSGVTAQVITGTSSPRWGQYGSDRVHLITPPAGGTGGYLIMDNAFRLRWDSASGLSGVDTGISRSSAGVVEINNGTTGQLRDLQLRAINASGNADFTGVLDASTATRTRPWKTGTTLPATCSLGDVFFKTDAPAGQNIYACTAVNTWTLQAGSGGSMAIQGNGSAVGTRATLDFVDGTGITNIVTDTGSKITVQTAIGSSVQTKAADQSGAHLLCAAGNTTTLTCSMSPTLTAYTDKMLVNLCVTGAVTGATTLNIDTLGAKAVQTAAGANPGSGDLGTGCRVVTYYSADNAFKLPAGGSAAQVERLTLDLGGCHNSGFGGYPQWGLAGGSTTNCGSTEGSAHLTLGFPNTGTPYIVKTLRIPSSYTGQTATARLIVTQINDSPSGVFDIRMATACVADGGAINVEPTYNTAVSTGEVATPGINSTKHLTLGTISLSGCSANSWLWVKVWRHNSTTGSNWGHPLQVVDVDVRY